MDWTFDKTPDANVTDISQLSGLAAQARLYSENLAVNMFELGRVFTEAKRLVRHGEWGQWLKENSGMGERSAQQLMQVYARFGDQPQLMGVEKSKLFKMLSLPSGQEESFIADNDLKNMSSREVEAAVKQARAEMQAQLDEALQNRLDAVNQVEALQQQLLDSQDNDHIPDEIADTLRRQEATIRQQQAMLEAAQETINESSRKLVEQERRSAREDAMPEETLDEALRAAVSAFLSSPAGTAAEDSRRVMALDAVERQDVSRLVDMMESWCGKMRDRLNEISTEGVIS
jgi:hypothetical protein